MLKKRIKQGVMLLLTTALLISTVPAFAAESTTNRGAGVAIGRMYGSMRTVIADLLGMSESDLIAARQSGQSMVDIAKEKGIEKEQLIDKVVSTRKDTLQQLVADGKITQEQANYCLQNLETRIESNMERTTTGNIWKGNRGAKGFGRGGYGLRGNSSQL
ncbi:DUF2680 domain-containing protein [Zhaonella formicivorans]|uniref:DUF2680 domain-containing protein n=1 Tax=Zhaonella formicivorans TaxID=2528593 RepID=UPI0010CE61BB|nr:DUF2680 domain-containing protein [Zhaonella formicivorans]